MEKIGITCDTCKKTHQVTRTDEIPKHVVSMGCNWCPDCEDKADDYYSEWYNESDGKEPEPDIPDNQLYLPLDDILPDDKIVLTPSKVKE